ncbi:MAG: hypothetical protein MJ232_06695 [archaeon]|nr:hypothetical protein [archaeon]
MTDYDDDIFNNDLESKDISKKVKPKQDLFDDKMESKKSAPIKQFKKESVKDSIQGEEVKQQKRVAPSNPSIKSKGSKFRKSIDSSLPDDFIPRQRNVPTPEVSNGPNKPVRPRPPKGQGVPNGQMPRGQRRPARPNPNGPRRPVDSRNSPMSNRSRDSQGQGVPNGQMPRGQRRPARPNPNGPRRPVGLNSPEGVDELRMMDNQAPRRAPRGPRHNPQRRPRPPINNGEYRRVRPKSFEEFSREELERQRNNRNNEKRNSGTSRNKRMVVAIGVLALIVIFGILAVTVSNWNQQEDSTLKVNISGNQFTLPDNTSIINQSDSEVNFKINGTKCLLKEIPDSDTKSYLTNVTESNYYVDKASNDDNNLTTYSFINGVKNTSGYIVLFHKDDVHYLLETYESGIPVSWLNSDVNKDLLKPINEFCRLNN